MLYWMNSQSIKTITKHPEHLKKYSLIEIKLK